MLDRLTLPNAARTAGESASFGEGPGSRIVMTGAPRLPAHPGRRGQRRPIVMPGTSSRLLAAGIIIPLA
jgi:hypothetical protein